MYAITRRLAPTTLVRVDCDYSGEEGSRREKGTYYGDYTVC